MTFENKPKQKLYYSIGEVAKMFDVNASLIRFWEGEFNVIKPKKNKKGNRMFTQKDIENFEKIFFLIKTKGFTHEGAKKALKSKEVKDDIPINIYFISAVRGVLKELTLRLVSEDIFRNINLIFVTFDVSKLLISRV